MSEFQFVKFRAVDRPLSDKQLEFMDRQSSRAEATKWEFEVEYNYASFRGDVDGGEQGNQIARRHAAHLAMKYPTLNILKSSLRKKELLD